MKTIYIAGSFYRNNDSLEHDFRSHLLGDSELLLHQNNESYVIWHGEKVKYIGPFFFYNDEKSLLPEQDNIVFTEKMMIDRCDIFISYFGQKSSPGSVAELVYAASLHKPIEIFYLETDNGREIKTEYWFPIVMSRYIDENVVKVTPVKCANEFMEKLKAPL